MTRDELLALDGLDLGTVGAALESHVGEALRGILNANRQQIAAWFSDLSRVAVESARKFAAGEISAEQFDAIMDVQYMSAKNVLLYAENLPLVAAQTAVNAAFTVLGYAVLNATGLNLAPELVSA